MFWGIAPSVKARLNTAIVLEIGLPVLADNKKNDNQEPMNIFLLALAMILVGGLPTFSRHFSDGF